MAKLNNLKVKAYGKLNLTLDVAGVRSDGYHMLETVMQSVSVYDLLEFTISEGSGIKLICDKKDFPLDERNLIWKAIEAFFEYCNLEMNERITVKIVKNIPEMAGMAGGSADCAAALGAMNVMFNTGLSKEQLCEIGIKLGADVPFCIMGGTCLCRGIGEKMTKLCSPDCFFTIIKPNISISTPEAFKKYDSIEKPIHCNIDDFLNSLKSGNLITMCQSMFNALEYACEFNIIKNAKQKLIDNGAISALMTGSGSAVFGVFKTEKEAQNAAFKLSNWDYRTVCKPISVSYEILDEVL